MSNLGISALDYNGKRGIAIALGHAPIAGNLEGVSLSANWMWPAKQEGETARLLKAVKVLSDYCVTLGINVLTGKDSLSITQK